MIGGWELLAVMPRESGASSIHRVCDRVAQCYT